MRMIAALLLLLISAAFLAGCTAHTAGGQEIARDSVRAHFEHHGDWSPGLGCYEKVTGYAYNAGSAESSPVMLGLNLIDIRTQTVRDSRIIWLGVLGPGQSRTFETDLDGECVQDYRVEGTVVP